jgi:hypothetical protein
MPAADVAEKTPRKRVKPRTTPLPATQSDTQAKKRIEREEDRQDKKTSNVAQFKKKVTGNESSG